MNYQEALRFLYEQIPMFTREGAGAYKPGLDNIIRICELLGNPHHQFKSIHIGGTNGKGSTSHFLASVLQCAGYKTGLFTSPHLKKFTERIKINGVEMPEQYIVDFINNFYDDILRINPSFFEITCAMAFDYFAHEGIEVAIVEVGLGGRLDATNIITPELSVITNIGYDHMDLLGNTLTLIAGEKAGIIKQGVPVVISEEQPEIDHVFTDKAKSVAAPLFHTDDIEIELLRHTSDFLYITVKVKDEVYAENVGCGLAGYYQLKNLKGVLKSLLLLNNQSFNIKKEHMLKGMLEVKELTGLQGRWQKLANAPLIVCDTAHNESGIREIVKQIALIDYNQLFIVFGVVKDKDIEKIMEIMPKNAHYYFTNAHIPRALEAEKLQIIAQKHGLTGESIPDVNKAIDKARKQAKTGDFIFIGGSTFIVAEIDTSSIG